MNSIFTGFNEINKKIPVVMPMHPRTRSRVKELGIDFHGMELDPLGYFDILQLLKNCKVVITDSGGLQKEAYFNQKPCVIVREETEWKELVQAGYAALAGRKGASIYKAVFDLLDQLPQFDSDLYGDEVGEKMYQVIKGFLERK